jgi:hypothetical protein
MTVDEFKHIVDSLPLQPALDNFLNTGKEWTSSLATPEQIETSKAALDLNPEFRTPDFIGLTISRNQNNNQAEGNYELKNQKSYSIQTAIRYLQPEKIGFRLVRPASQQLKRKQPTK